MSDEILINMSNALGRIEAKTDSTIEWMKKHSDMNVLDFGKTNGAVKVLELEYARQRGAAKVWSLWGAVGGAILGAASSYFAGKH